MSESVPTNQRNPSKKHLKSNPFPHTKGIHSVYKAKGHEERMKQQHEQPHEIQICIFSFVEDRRIKSKQKTKTYLQIFYGKH